MSEEYDKEELEASISVVTSPSGSTTVRVPRSELDVWGGKKDRNEDQETGDVLF